MHGELDARWRVFGHAITRVLAVALRTQTNSNSSLASRNALRVINRFLQVRERRNQNKIRWLVARWALLWAELVARSAHIGVRCIHLETQFIRFVWHFLFLSSFCHRLVPWRDIH